MSRSVKSIFVLLAVIIVGLIGYYTLKLPTDTPGANRPAEIIDPVLLTRTSTSWDQVLKHGVPDMAGAGGYIAPVPGKDYWGYVTNPGKPHPCESLPIEKRTPLYPK